MENGRPLLLDSGVSAYSQPMPSLTFLGAVGMVTGSKHLLDIGSHRLLIDCGLFQGLKELRDRNWQPFPIAPTGIDAVILTHAHLDTLQSGNGPCTWRLIRNRWSYRLA